MSRTNDFTKNPLLTSLGSPPLSSGNQQPPISQIDPTLESCCQREIEANRRQAHIETNLHLHDRIAKAERRRKLHVLNDLEFGSGCRCSYSHEDGGEYSALTLAREQSEAAAAASVGGYGSRGGGGADDETECAVAGKSIVGDCDDDSSDEFDYLLDDDIDMDDGDGESPSFKIYEEERRLELEFMALHMEMARQHGYGVHRQMHPARVLHAAGLGMQSFKPCAAVIHLYDPESMASGRLDLLLEGERIADVYRGTKFIRASGRSVLMMNKELISKSLRISLGREIRVDSDLPCLIAVRNGEVVAVCPRLNGLVYGDVERSDVRVDGSAVEHWLDRAGVLVRNAPPYVELCRIRPEEDALYNTKMVVDQHDTEEFYDCGVSGCQKTFSHKHVGVSNEHQDGMMIAEEDINGH